MSLSTLRVARFPISILITAMVLVGLLLFPGPAYGVQTVIGVVSGSVLPDDTSGDPQYVLGETIVFPEAQTTIEFTHPEEAVITNVKLIVSGPQGMTVNLPINAGTYTASQLPDPSQVVGDLTVTVVLDEVTGQAFAGYGIFAGYGYKSTASTARIKYRIEWTPPVLLDPPPTFSLITNGDTDTEFAIPQLSPPAPLTGTLLPSTDLEFTIPQVGAPSFGTVLPSTIEAWTGGDIPALTVVTNASSALDALPNTTDLSPFGFNIPQLSVGSAPSGVADFPDTSADFDIPQVAFATASGVPDAPEASVAYTVPAGGIGRALGTDGTNFWVVSENAGTGGVDLLVELAASGVATGTTIDGPSSSVEGIAFLNSRLFVAESLFRCFDLIEVSTCDRSHRVFQIDPTDAPTSEATWAETGKTIKIFSLVDNFAEIGGITAEGSGATGSLWISNKFGWSLYNVTQTGSELSTPFPDRFVERMDAIAFNSSNNLLYTVDNVAGQVSSWTTTGKQVQQYNMVIEGGSTKVPGIRGLTFKTVSGAEVLFMAANTGDVYQTFFPATVTTSPRGVAYSGSTSTPGEALWVLVDAEPKDKLLKVDPSDGSLITSFGTDGAVDAPSGETQGITFFSSALWIVANDSDTRNLYKVSATTGAVLNTYDLQNTANIFDDLGGITNNGTNLVVHTRSFQNTIWEVDTVGEPARAETAYPCCPTINGVRGLTYNSGRLQYFGVRNSDLTIYDENLNFQSSGTLTQTAGSITAVRGLDFNGDLLYAAHLDGSTGKISKSFLPTVVTTKPTGIAHTPSTSVFGDALYILVDAEPADRLLKVDPSTGTLITGFSTDGAVDAPSGATAGITFVDTGTASTSFLWIVANEGSGCCDTSTKLYKVNPTTGALVSTVTVSSAFGEIGGITNDGTNLVLFYRNNAEVLTVDTTGAQVSSGFLGPNNTFGANGFARHAGRGQYFAAKGSSLLTVSSNFQEVLAEQNLSVDGSGLSGAVQGLVFDQDVFYVARVQAGEGKVSVGKLVADVSTDPRGLAFSPAGSTLAGQSIGQALWVLVDGTPLDVILKVDSTTGALDTGFSTDGAVDAPTGKTEGMTYLAGHLWVISNGTFGDRTLYKIKATDGSVANTFNVGGFVWDDIGGVTNDGTNILLFSKNSDQVWTVDQNGDSVSQSFVQGEFGPGGSSNAAAYRADASQVMLGDQGDLTQYVADNGNFNFADDFSPSGVTGIKGAAFDAGTAGDAADDVLYVAHATGKISKTAVPGDVSNKPRALAYDSGADELYILVDGKGKAPDHIVVVDPDAGSTVIRDFPAPNEQAGSMTYLDGALYVGYSNNQGGGGGGSRIAVLDPSDGSTDDTLDVFFGTPIGMGNDGTNLLITEQNFGRINVVNRNSGNSIRDVFLFDPTDPFRDFFSNNFRALAFRSGDEEFFPVANGTVHRFDADGRLVAEFETTGLGEIQGAVFTNGKLFLAEDGSNTIQSALVPLPTVTITNDPRGIATDGTSLFIAVDAEPVDKIMKVDTGGTLDTSFGESASGAADGGAIDAPGTAVGDLTFLDGSLYAVTNDLRTFNDQGGSFSVQLPVVHEIDPATGLEVSRLMVLRDFPEGEVDPSVVLFDSVGAIATDGDSLFLGVSAGDDQSDFASGIEAAWFAIDPGFTLGFDPTFNASFVVAEDRTDEFSGVFDRMDGFSAFEFTPGDEFQDGSRLLGAGDVGNGSSDAVARMGAEDGVMRSQYALAGTDIQGMALIGIDLLLADDETDTILATSLPERTVEQTVVGGYSGLLRATVALNETTFQNEDSATPALFSIERSPDVQVSLDLAEGFVVTTVSQTITGKVSDPSIESVDVSVQLPFTALVDDEVILASSGALWNLNSNGAAAWHITCDGDTPAPLYESGPCAWRFGRPGQSDFDTGSTVTGGMRLAAPVDVAADTKLAFETVYQTQPDPGNDKKLVQVAIVSQDLQGNDVVGPFETVAAIVGSQFVGSPQPGGAHSSFQYLGLNPFVSPGSVSSFHRFEIGLGAFAGERVIVKFAFNSVNAFNNTGAGWYLDDIQVLGAGATTVAVGTTLLTTPVVEGGTVFFRTFSTSRDLSEGPNVVSAKAVQSYSPFLSGQDSRSGFLDQTNPAVSMSGIAPVVSSPNQTLTLNVSDPTFVLVQLNQSGITQPIFASTSDGAFDVAVVLAEGETTFTAYAEDAGGRSTSVDLVVNADFTAPDVTVGYRPIINSNGVRAGDPFFIMVDASDASGTVDTGIGAVIARLPGGTTVDLAPIGDIESVVRLKHGLDSFGTSTTTHVGMIEVEQGTPVGFLQVIADAVDGAGLIGTGQVNASVVAGLSDRSVYLGSGTNYVGFPLVLNPAALETLLLQEITNVNPQLEIDLGRVPRLEDVIASVYAHTGGSAGDFVYYVPGDATDTLDSISPFDGLIVSVRSVVGTTPVFTEGTVFGATVQVPIRWNASGVFQESGAALPPSKDFAAGFNLWSPHATKDDLFERPGFLRAAVVAGDVAVSAITQINRIDAVLDTDEPGNIGIEVENRFQSSGPGDLLTLQRAYWTFMVAPATITP